MISVLATRDSLILVHQSLPRFLVERGDDLVNRDRDCLVAGIAIPHDVEQIILGANSSDPIQFSATAGAGKSDADRCFEEHGITTCL